MLRIASMIAAPVAVAALKPHGKSIVGAPRTRSKGDVERRSPRETKGQTSQTRFADDVIPGSCDKSGKSSPSTSDSESAAAKSRCTGKVVENAVHTGRSARTLVDAAEARMGWRKATASKQVKVMEVPAMIGAFFQGWPCGFTCGRGEIK